MLLRLFSSSSYVELRSMALSAVMTIEIVFHQSGYRTFKVYYTQCVAAHL